MLKKIKNSIIGKCLQVLLIGYFLLNSINMPNSLGSYIEKNAELHCIKGKTCQVLKMLFKWGGVPEELEDYEICKTKTDKSGKGIQLLEYLVPINTSLPYINYMINDRACYNHDLGIPVNSYNKIYLPPPEAIL